MAKGRCKKKIRVETIYVDNQVYSKAILSTWVGWQYTLHPESKKKRKNDKLK